jgi:hypothetical protein
MSREARSERFGEMRATWRNERKCCSIAPDSKLKELQTDSFLHATKLARMGTHSTREGKFAGKVDLTSNG